jgi:4-amino-4-deoxy-L-arabinose transferase-like glycosyltransferase
MLEVGLLILIGSAIVLIVHSWSVLSGTVDEPYHVANGLDWLEHGIQEDFQQPPLAQGAIALGLYLQGKHFPAGNAESSDKGVAILQSGGNYRDNLKLARLGDLPFFFLGCLIVWLWASRWFNRATAGWAVLLFVCLPPILAHSALATVDMAGAATVAIALYAFVRCLENPSWQGLALLGAAVALAFLSKFSSIAFLGSCYFFAFIYLGLRKRGATLKALRWRRLSGRALIVAAVAFVSLWAGYHFSFRPAAYKSTPYQTLDHVLAKTPRLRILAYKAITVPLPLTEFLRGIYEVGSHNERGHDSYLLGKYRKTGWWYFFPVVVGVKTPIGFLILAGWGMMAILRGLQPDAWQQHLTIIFAVAIMLVCMDSRIDLGVRHILPIYPLLAVIAGYAASEIIVLAKRISPAIAVLPILLALWIVADAWTNRADELAYFNQCAGSHPERILADSDLDWGQDLYLLSSQLKELGVEHVAIKYFGTAPLDNADLPPYSSLSSDVPITHGYAAISVRYLTLEYAKDGSFEWLKSRTPLETVGKSIYLYNLDH